MRDDHVSSIEEGASKGAKNSQKHSPLPHTRILKPQNVPPITTISSSNSAARRGLANPGPAMGSELNSRPELHTEDSMSPDKVLGHPSYFEAPILETHHEFYPEGYRIRQWILYDSDFCDSGLALQSCG
jgi:hypothetical protein